jgi:hypothetical protein
MATNTLFDSENQQSASKKVVIIIISLLIVFAAGGFGLWKYSNNVEKKAKILAEEQFANDRMRDSIVMLLAQPRFSGEQFREQMLGDARLQKFSIREKEAYFSLPESSELDFENSVNNFVIDRTKIENAQEVEGEFTLGRYSLRKTPETGFFFKTSLENLKFKTNTELKFPFQTATYTLGLQELIDFSNNSQIYGGKLNADTNQKSDEDHIVFANHGAMVAKPDEPSLKRFVAELLRDVPNNKNREVKIQRLLDFVTNEIEYDYTEAVGSRETLKRPDEVLMSRTSDCSNKTILMASLLEQIGEDYLLLYCPQHITVAVPQGDFPNENKLSFNWSGKDWMIAETTLPNFVIGKTRVTESVKLTSVQYVQKPKQTDVIFEAQTFRPLEFR